MTEDRFTQLEERVKQLENRVRLMPFSLLASVSIASLLISLYIWFRLR